jgi:hypothetical protein
VFGDIERRDNNVVIAGAAAQVSRNPDLDLFFDWIRIVA